MNIINFFGTVLLFLFVLCILVFVHEYGHYIVARLVNVKVLRFSIGFGKVLFSFKNRHNTEFAFSVIPLGGYVKMLNEQEGEVAPEELPYAFNRKPVLSKMAVVLAGPLFNFLFAILAYWCMFMLGTQESVPLIGRVDPNSIAAMAGITPMQEITKINDEPVTSWNKVRLELVSHLGENGQLMLTLKDYKSGAISQHALVLNHWETKDVQAALLQSLGLHPYFPKIPLTISEVASGSPADQAGIKAKDLMFAVNEKKLNSWDDLLDIIAQHPGEKINLTVLRGQEKITIPVLLDSISDGAGKEVGFLGVQSVTPDWPADLIRIQRYSPVQAIMPAISQTADMFLLSWKLLGKMVVGELPMDSLSGPIGIAKGARYSASLGTAYFFNFLALISLSLCMVNLLPIPILDGGHFLYFFIEAILRRPLSERAQEVGMRIGLFILILLTSLAVFNDLSHW